VSLSMPARAATFGLGDHDSTIAMVDANGVAMVFIPGCSYGLGTRRAACRSCPCPFEGEHGEHHAATLRHGPPKPWRGTGGESAAWRQRLQA
jgi:hypothetical protein